MSSSGFSVNRVSVTEFSNWVLFSSGLNQVLLMGALSTRSDWIFRNKTHLCYVDPSFQTFMILSLWWQCGINWCSSFHMSGINYDLIQSLFVSQIRPNCVSFTTARLNWIVVIWISRQLVGPAWSTWLSSSRFLNHCTHKQHVHITSIVLIYTFTVSLYVHVRSILTMATIKRSVLTIRSKGANGNCNCALQPVLATNKTPSQSVNARYSNETSQRQCAE